MPIHEREETHATTELGAAQKDTARELAAKLSNLNCAVWVGIAMFIFGLASFVWPPLRTIIGSVTTSAALTAGGILLTVLPSLIIGNETLILGAVGLAVGAWFLAHRHGQLRGALETHQNLKTTELPTDTKSRPRRNTTITHHNGAPRSRRARP
jgi:hypothetical protein